MAITINPNLQPVAPTAPSAPVSGVVLQPGQVITAEVLQVLGNDQVQIAIGNLTIEATTQVPLQAGQTLQLQVSQTSSGIGLSIVNQPGTATSQAGTTNSEPVVTLSPSLAASLAANLSTNAATPANPLTQIELSAVSIAAQTAVTQQTSLAPLFADLNVAAGLPRLPAQVQQAVVQVLAQQTTLDPNLTGDAVRQAFQSSGILLEASLASGSAVTPGSVPDLKAALIVLRQALTSALSDGAATTGTVTPTSVPQVTASQAAVTTEATASSAASAPNTTPVAPATSGSVPTPVAVSPAQPATVLAAAVLAEASELLAAAGPLSAATVADAAAPDILPGLLVAPPTAATTAAPGMPAQDATSALAEQILELVGSSTPSMVPATTSTEAAMRAAASSAALNLLQEVLQASPSIAANVSNLVLQNSQLLSLLPVITGARTQAAVDDDALARTSIPPPPTNGALPSAQPVVPATLAAHVPVEAALQHLLSDTDGAIARQTLLQIASLPGQADPSASSIDASAPRWNFEIPFATPQGTAMAQFEISRDGTGREVSAAKATWRARFSLNVEPAGPVHALVSLNGDRASVKMWAERPSTATQLRAGISQLTQALNRADLMPGDIVVRDGAPQPPAPAPAGHFLDRAS